MVKTWLLASAALACVSVLGSNGQVVTDPVGRVTVHKDTDYTLEYVWDFFPETAEDDRHVIMDVVLSNVQVGTQKIFGFSLAVVSNRLVDLSSVDPYFLMKGSRWMSLTFNYENDVPVLFENKRAQEFCSTSVTQCTNLWSTNPALRVRNNYGRSRCTNERVELQSITSSITNGMQDMTLRFKLYEDSFHYCRRAESTEQFFTLGMSGSLLTGFVHAIWLGSNLSEFPENDPIRYNDHAYWWNRNTDLLKFGFTVPSPTNAPTPQPTRAPNATPTLDPTASPTKKPTSAPTSAPTLNPTASPTKKPTSAPNSAPTPEPTEFPTAFPTTTPPTLRPTTAFPTKLPTAFPTDRPTTAFPTKLPTASPTDRPTRTRAPSNSPTFPAPTNSPTTPIPTTSPTPRPSRLPPAELSCPNEQDWIECSRVNEVYKHLTKNPARRVRFMRYLCKTPRFRTKCAWCPNGAETMTGCRPRHRETGGKQSLASVCATDTDPFPSLGCEQFSQCPAPVAMSGCAYINTLRDTQRWKLRKVCSGEFEFQGTTIPAGSCTWCKGWCRAVGIYKKQSNIICNTPGLFDEIKQCPML